MKDNLSLIAAAAGGFMLSVALSGILRGTPVTIWPGQVDVTSYRVTNSLLASVRSDESESYFEEKQK
ncbi:hypothetical protein I8752_17045 [Nostocaceae cyanobacterium CENA369]|uniref:Uncharacterized protein n=1 Tax=Dendronalium phyllosphericum CENA369 TaxID=1725256 RepID=A0A8J7LGA6_9NOST|nr:hypothetical protein [Dendronalium phyllosphericum]MBH8574699.1 hypothetical protein [Dendronalium phyllosphericum CENA369]